MRKFRVWKIKSNWLASLLMAKRLTTYIYPLGIWSLIHQFHLQSPPLLYTYKAGVIAILTFLLLKERKRKYQPLDDLQLLQEQSSESMSQKWVSQCITGEKQHSESALKSMLLKKLREWWYFISTEKKKQLNSALVFCFNIMSLCPSSSCNKYSLASPVTDNNVGELCTTHICHY